MKKYIVIIWGAMIMAQSFAQSAKFVSQKTITIAAVTGFSARIAFAPESPTAVAQLAHTDRLVKDSVYQKMGQVPKMLARGIMSCIAAADFSIADMGTIGKPLYFDELQQALYLLFSKQSTGQAGDLLVEHQNNLFFVAMPSGKQIAIATSFIGEDGMWFLDSFSGNERFPAGLKVFVRPKN